MSIEEKIKLLQKRLTEYELDKEDIKELISRRNHPSVIVDIWLDQLLKLNEK